jgi:nitrate/nitrite-specific signal transduction histidine kinase
MTEGTNLRAEFSVEGEPQPIPQEWEANLLRVSQEVLTNTLRHALATQFKVRLQFDAESVRMELRDNGSGFDPAKRDWRSEHYDEVISAARAHCNLFRPGAENAVAKPEIDTRLSSSGANAVSALGR